jgi:hypothetical protein
MSVELAKVNALRELQSAARRRYPVRFALERLRKASGKRPGGVD